MKIAIGSDHGGYTLKEYLKETLISKGLEVQDEGCFTQESVDYPDFGKKVAKKVSAGEVDAGILICKSGIGMSITANRFERIRAALCYNEEAARLSKAHTNSNILVLGSQFVSFEESEKIVNIWLSTPFEGGRHTRRLSEIDEG